MTLTNFIGVDPGLKGAIARLSQSGAIEVFDIPTHEITIGGKKRNRLDDHSLAALVAALSSGVQLAIIEDVHAMPKQGVTSSFTFGDVFGCLRMSLACNRIPYHRVAPGPWKRYFDVKADKDSSRQRASQLFPKFAHLWARKKDDGRAEAALLAYYASKFYARVLS